MPKYRPTCKRFSIYCRRKQTRQGRGNLEVEDVDRRGRLVHDEKRGKKTIEGRGRGSKGEGADPPEDGDKRKRDRFQEEHRSGRRDDNLENDEKRGGKNRPVAREEVRRGDTRRGSSGSREDSDNRVAKRRSR